VTEKVTTLNGFDAGGGGPSTDGSTAVLPDTPIVTIGAEFGSVDGSTAKICVDIMI
jgi:hypothetical protein